MEAQARVSGPFRWVQKESLRAGPDQAKQGEEVAETDLSEPPYS